MKTALMAAALLMALAIPSALPSPAAAAKGDYSAARAEKRAACMNATKYTVSDRGRGWRSRFRACMQGQWAAT